MSTQWQQARATLKKLREAKKYYCRCGCGQEVAIAKQSDARFGYIQGKPRRFANGHSLTRRVQPKPATPLSEPAPFSDARRLYREEKAKRDAAKESLLQAAAAQFAEAMAVYHDRTSPQASRASKLATKARWGTDAS